MTFLHLGERKIVLPFLTFIAFAGLVFVYYASSTDLITNNSIDDVSKHYTIMITPSPWTSGIWDIIFAWQFMWILYLLFLCCKYEMEKLIIGPIFYMVFILSNIINGIWIILWCNEYIIISGVLLIFCTIFLYICMMFSHYYLIFKANVSFGFYDYDNEIPHWLNDAKKSILLILLLNGISFYTQWIMITSCITIGIIIFKTDHALDETASFISLAILSCVQLMYWFIECTKKGSKILKYTFSPHVALILVLIGMITDNGINPNEYPPSVMVCVLLCISVVVLFLKLYRSIFQQNESNWNGSFLSVQEC